MKVKQLKEILERTDDDLEVVVILSQPSMGPRANMQIESAHRGIDWEKNYFCMEPKAPISEKTKEEGVYYNAHELIMYLATKKMTRDSYEVTRAKAVLKRAGYTEADFDKYRHLFHKENT